MALQGVLKHKNFTSRPIQGYSRRRLHRLLKCCSLALPNCIHFNSLLQAEKVQKGAYVMLDQPFKNLFCDENKCY